MSDVHIFEAIENNNLETLEKYLKEGGDVNGSVDGCTNLTIAAFYNNYRCVEMLLKYGADVNLQDCHGATALIYSALKGNYHISKILMEHGADPDITNCDGHNALAYVTFHYYLYVKLLKGEK